MEAPRLHAIHLLAYNMYSTSEAGDLRIGVPLGNWGLLQAIPSRRPFRAGNSTLRAVM